MIVYFLSGYNNYYNRELKGYSFKNISDYSDYIVFRNEDKNFNPNDNVNAITTLNYVAPLVNTSDPDDVEIDYVLISEDGNSIKSKWFVMDRTRNRKAQWVLNLRRDLLADYFTYIKTSPIFFEKGYLNAYNKLIFNSENMSYNQIKKKEILLKDKTKSAWVVGYMANNYYESLITQQKVADNQVYVDFNRNIERTPQYEASYSELSRLGQIFTGATINNQTLSIVVSTQYLNMIFTQGQGAQILNQTSTRYNCVFAGTTNNYYNDFRDQFINADPFFMAPRDISNYLSGYKMNIDNLRAMNNQYIKNTDVDGPEYFYFRLLPDIITEAEITPPVGSTLYNDIKTYIRSIMSNYVADDYISFVDSNVNGFRMTIPVSGYHCVTSTEVPDLTARAYLGTMSGGTINQPKQELDDAPYTMFCMPYSNINVYNGTDNLIFESQGTVCTEMGAAISKTLGGGGGTSYIYDLQLLPYCPIPNIYDEDENRIDLTSSDEITYAYIISESEDKTYPISNSCGIILFPNRSSFSLTINLAEPIAMPANAIEAKVDIETKFCRLVSPNYAGVFEFNPLKNGGVSSFEVNATYKPYQPYIHLNPSFNTGFLYGGDFNDNRGLICGGDFSLPQINDAWINYQTQNRSYREAFNRSIENMETNNAIQREREVISAITGGISGAISGATGGALAGSAGGPVGSAIGAGIGLVASTAGNIYGGIKDLELSDKLRKEGIDFTKDMFGYNLQNIRALPTTMSRTSSFDINNKLYPVLEFYEATMEEVDALINKIKYNGMTIMTIGYIDNYTDYNKRYIKGQLIKLLDADGYPVCEMHETSEIASELMKGVYI